MTGQRLIVHISIMYLVFNLRAVFALSGPPTDGAISLAVANESEIFAGSRHSFFAM